ncbi:MAG: hypothetical protein ACO1O4_01175 [Devosia sp.]
MSKVTMVNKPQNFGEHLEQYRDPIVKSAGFTPTERHLAQLASRTFLELWSYPSPFRDQYSKGITDGKEICDLMVVCDPHIILFSEKNISWSDKPVEVAWPRWYRKAVLEAAQQLTGAERWLRDHPDRIFLDHACEHPFPLALPPPERRKIHRVVVANGAAKACRAYFDGGSGSLVISPDIRGNDHADAKSKNFEPFAIGDVQPDSDFIHVLDEASLDVVMREMDTITDFVGYLDKRAAFLRSGNLAIAAGEEDLIAYYATRLNSDGDHDFAAPGGGVWKPDDRLAISPGEYDRFVANEQYTARAAANKPSYFWDHLIETFSQHMMDGTSIVLPGFKYELTSSEVAVRYMAQANRFRRRNFGKACLGALETGKTRDVFFRAMLGTEGSKDAETGFFFLTLKYQERMEKTGGYEKYRLFRTSYLQIYAQALLMKHRYLDRVIGIAMEPPDQGRGASEDLIYAGQHDWTDEQRAQNQEDCERYGIMNGLKMRVPQESEFPQPKKSKLGYQGTGNRKQRRAAAAAQRGRRP